MLGNFTTSQFHSFTASQLHKLRIGVYPPAAVFMHLSPARLRRPNTLDAPLVKPLRPKPASDLCYQHGYSEKLGIM
jgi:hypothetical protein